MVEKDKTASDQVPSYKVVMLGESGVGKTCIVNRYLKGSYIMSESTVGSNFSSKVEQIKIQGLT